MPEPRAVHILWKDASIETSRFMVLFYATNSKMNNLWDNVTVILWGATVKLAAENEVIQEEMKVAQHVGVKFSACASCARRMGLTEKLEELGVEVVPWVEPLTDLIKNGEPIIYA
ncbi:MAG: DsrE family protein [Defluviitaleaceae bacterium]|nr:DsrE family protein [Defluviitaleaceae bacterium]